MKKYKTEQEDFWAGTFGRDYIKRNKNQSILKSNVKMFERILSRTTNVKTLLELGSNIGLNLMAIQQLNPEYILSAVEINSIAVEELKENISQVKVINKSILDFNTNEKWDFVFTKGVLIHINPTLLRKVYDLIYKVSKKYILIAEYYNPYPVELKYRGFEKKLFKRDFAGELLNNFKDLKLVDYGFVYHRDKEFPQDDITWFLLTK